LTWPPQAPNTDLTFPPFNSTIFTAPPILRFIQNHSVEVIKPQNHQNPTTRNPPFFSETQISNQPKTLENNTHFGFYKHEHELHQTQQNGFPFLTKTRVHIQCLKKNSFLLYIQNELPRASKD
jgi:hypothetical protein